MRTRVGMEKERSGEENARRVSVFIVLVDGEGEVGFAHSAEDINKGNPRHHGAEEGIARLVGSCRQEQTS